MIHGSLTPVQVVKRLETLLKDQLGTYVGPGTGGGSTAALHLDDPPDTWRTEGLEVIVYSHPEASLQATHQGGSLGKQILVRFVQHSGGNDAIMSAVERVVSAFDTTSPLSVPANERLGILAGTTLLIRS